MDTDKNYIKLKLTITSLWDVPDELTQSFYKICRPVCIKKGQQFIKAGEIPEIMGFNLNGLFRLYYIDSEGNDLTKGFSTPGKFVVSYSAMAQKRDSFFLLKPSRIRIYYNLTSMNGCSWSIKISDGIPFYSNLWKQFIS